jgi:aryl-alcohol dehydrogenase-like predicted oxidoreductase
MTKRELTKGYEISPVIKGGWQLSSGHSLNTKIEDEQAISDTVAFVEAGISTLDFGDIYTGVEELIGKAVNRLTNRDLVQLHTKYVPNENFLHDFDCSDVETIVDRSLSRLGVDQVDLVQFHWWKYEANNYLVAMEELFKLKAAGKIRHVGITNFDLPHVKEFVEGGFKPASIQLQYSILDRRPENGLVDYCIEHDIGILCYGTVAGGVFSEKFLGAPEPKSVETRSNVKYQLIIEEFGGWPLFQKLLRTLKEIADSHETDIATISSAYTLSRPGVKGVIVGARNVSHLQSNLKIPEIAFTGNELAVISNIISEAKGPDGDVYQLERYSDKHRNIMHTNNN